MIRRPRTASRSGAAAVECAVVLNFVLVPLMIGTWEVGRLVHINQVVSHSAREGARLAAQAVTIGSDGNQSRILTTIDPTGTPPAGWSYGDPNVKAAVFQALYAGGLDRLAWDDVIVEFKYLDQPTVTLADGSLYVATEGASTTNPNPYTGVQNQKFTVRVALTPAGYQKVRWTGLGITSVATVDFTVEWRMMVDIPFYVNQTLPRW